MKLKYNNLNVKFNLLLLKADIVIVTIRLTANTFCTQKIHNSWLLQSHCQMSIADIFQWI